MCKIVRFIAKARRAEWTNTINGDSNSCLQLWYKRRESGVTQCRLCES